MMATSGKASIYGNFSCGYFLIVSGETGREPDLFVFI